MLTERIEKIRQNYVNSKPAISTERAYIWTNSEKKNEGKSVAIRSAQAFYDTCNELSVHIFEGELIVGAIGVENTVNVVSLRQITRMYYLKRALVASSKKQNRIWQP